MATSRLPRTVSDTRPDTLGGTGSNGFGAAERASAARPGADAVRHEGLVLALLALTQLLIVMDASIMNVAIPSIGADLRIDAASLAWVIGAYTLVFGGLLLLGGCLADILGRRRIFVTGVALFALTSLVGGLAQSDTLLILARGSQGIGAALMAPAALSMITTTFVEGPERTRALAVWGAVSGVGGAVGVLLGGALTEWASWRWVLLINVPLCLISIAAAPKLLPESRNTATSRSFDVVGAVLVTAGFGLPVYAFIDAEQVGWYSAQTTGVILGGLALLATFVLWERRVANPLVPLSIFRLRTLTGSNLAGVAVGAGLYGMFFLVSVYMQFVLGFDALEAGLGYLPLSLAALLVAGGATPLINRVGFKPVLVAGLTLITGGLFGFSRVSSDGTYLADILAASLVMGVGVGFTFVALTVGSVARTRPDQAGLASGLINTSQQVGGALGVAVMSTLAFSTFDPARPQPAALTDGLEDSFLLAGCLGIVAVVFALVVIRQADQPTNPDGSVVTAA